MPTFADIDFSRELGKRLVAISEKSDVCHPIETPQALLSRHPRSLRWRNEDGTISTNPLHCCGFPEVRHDVAKKLVANSLVGRRQELVKSILELQQEYQHEEEGHPENARPHKSSGQQFSGCVSALDLLKFQKSTISSAAMATNAAVPCCVSTGSLSLDALLGIPHPMAQSISSSINPRLCIPMPVRGIPWGHVVQCSGPSACGKTQLALQIAVSAASQCLSVMYLASAMGQGCLTPSVLRLRELASATCSTRSQSTALLDRVSFQVVQDAFQLLSCLAEVEESVLRAGTQRHTTGITNQPSNAFQLPAQVLILDAASGCLTTEDETLLQRVALRLKHLARHYHLIVWVNIASTIPRPKKPHRSTNQRHSIDGTGLDAADEILLGGTETNPSSGPVKVTPRPALGAVWQRSSWDIHISLRVTEEKVPIKLPEPRHPQQRQQHESYKQEMEAHVIRATLEAHPLKKCSPSKQRQQATADSNLTAEWYITARGIQDVSIPEDMEETEDML
ncbi:expressed unknown protein [Seminavis robusta]|uniref:Uncharacterized protein n=1 Tax=Seminavis robusta TaxID=568900 RepID=A0A9N8E692_9STRA|nr:expressed unknown protein [Seminavis robusta]|eukprot:Sro716_g191950.1 n/a (508) ;mRNA; r:46757-48280